MLTDKQIVRCLIGISDPMEVQRIGAMPIIAEFARAIADMVRAECVPQWQPIDSRYEVSNFGIVRDSDGRILGQWKNDQGYMLVRLSSPRRVERVHRLVAQAFITNHRSLDTVNHIDCNRANNAAHNLEWCTQADNLAHSDGLGRMQRDYWSGKRSPNARLSDDEVRAIRAEYLSGGVSHQSLSAKYKISKRCVGRVINMEVYSDVQ